MDARVFVTVAAVVALVGPAYAAADAIPVKRLAPHVAKHAAKPHVAPRVLCICVTIPASALPVVSEVELEADVDVDLIGHGVDPLYASFQTTPELQARYDAVLIAHGLAPYFGTGAGGGAPGG
jgi:hypothetical protein